MTKMKHYRLLAALLALLLGGTLRTEAKLIEFGYDAGAEIVSTYLWRGQYNGGLSFQPDLAVGWDSEHTSFRVGTWWSIGASDWKFRKGLPYTDDYNPNTYFIPELDIYANLNLWGVTLGFTHYYYFGGSNFFSAGNIAKVKELGNTSQTEISLGYDFSTLLDLPLYVTWNTMVSGDDGYLTGLSVNEEGEIEGEYKRAFSSYLEVGYTHTWEDLGLSFGGAIGMSPWKSLYTDMDWQSLDDETGEIVDESKSFAVNNISLRLEKEWSLGDDLCTISIFGVGMINTCNLNKNTAFVNAAGDDKLYIQKLNGAIGMSVWF
jgi:hypothetical protein